MKEANTFEEIMNLEWQLDEFNYYWLKVRVGNCEASFHMHGRPNYCDRGHWQVVCEYFKNDDGIDTIDQADFFPRLYMSLDTAKSEIAKFVAWRALKKSDGLKELIEHHSKHNYGGAL